MIAIIPARGGNKRPPRKSLLHFCGRPIIAYSIEAALQSGLFDHVMISTDDTEIANLSRELGAEIPFMQSAKVAADFAPTADVPAEVDGLSGQGCHSTDRLLHLSDRVVRDAGKTLSCPSEIGGNTRFDRNIKTFMATIAIAAFVTWWL